MKKLRLREELFPEPHSWWWWYEPRALWLQSHSSFVFSMALPLAAREGTVGSGKPWRERQTSPTTTLILTITTTCTRVCLGHEATQSLNPLAVSSRACYAVVGLFFRTLLLALGPDVTPSPSQAPSLTLHGGINLLICPRLGCVRFSTLGQTKLPTPLPMLPFMNSFTFQFCDHIPPGTQRFVFPVAASLFSSFPTL